MMGEKKGLQQRQVTLALLLSFSYKQCGQPAPTKQIFKWRAINSAYGTEYSAWHQAGLHSHLLSRSVDLTKTTTPRLLF